MSFGRTLHTIRTVAAPSVRRAALAAGFGLLASVMVRAQSGSIAGRVTDAQGAVVVNASVTLSGGPAARPIVTQSTADGTFRFDSIAPGRYTLQVESPGFKPWTREVVVGATNAAVQATLDVAGVIEDVQVSGRAPVTLSTPVPTASRLGLPPLETPASVAVVSGTLVRDLGTPTLVVAKALAPGITSSAPMGNGGNVINARGFTGANSVKQLFNGMELYNAGNVVSFPFDPWNVDHIGVLYGPASVLYGTGAIGGAINVVPRRPDPAQRRNEISLSAGRFGTYHEAIDSTGPLSARVSYRFDASLYNSGHWVERGESNSQAISGSIRFDATPTLRFTVSNDFGNQNPSKYLGTPVLNNAPVDALRSKNYNVLDAQLNFTDNWTNVETLWTPSATASLHNNTYAMYHDRVYRDVPTFAYVPATNQVRRTQFRDIDNTYETQVGDTGYMKFGARLFGRPNEVIGGLDVNRNYYKRNDNVRGGTSVVDALTFNPGNFLDFYSQQSKPFYRIHVDQVAGFFEDRFTATDKLSLVVGARRDRYHVNRYDELVFTTTDSDHNATGWNAGAVYEMVSDLSVYAQYAKASDPVNSLSSINANQQGFNLSPGRQVEVGIKQSWLRTRLEWTFAAYDLVKRDLLTPSIVNPTLTEQVGQQSSRGVEGSVAVNAGSVRVNVNGTVLRARFDDFKALAGSSVVSLAGNVPLNVPEKSANIIVFWEAAPAWQARGVLRYVGRRFADNTNAPASLIPSYSVLDLGVKWKARPRLGLDARIDNTLDEIYADSGSATAWLLGQPRSFTLSLNVLF
jgi:iron complex outermembrane recepter protein